MMLTSLKSDKGRPAPRQGGAMKVTVTLMCCGDLGSSSEQISPSNTTLLPDMGRKRWGMEALGMEAGARFGNAKANVGKE